MRRHWKTIAVVAAVAVIALSVVAVAYGATQVDHDERRAAGNGACGALMSNPKALRGHAGAAHRAPDGDAGLVRAVRLGPSGAEAQAALQQLRDEHWNDMRELFKKFGIKAPTAPGRAAA